MSGELTFGKLDDDGGTHESSLSCQTEQKAVPVSKNQLKKQRKREKWLQFKAQKRLAEKEKRKKRLAALREKGDDAGPSRKSLKKNSMEHSACRQKVVIDCSFDEYMTEKDITFLTQQLQHSYAANRRAENPLQLFVCGIRGKTKQRLDDIGDYKGWDIFKEERDYYEVFPKDDVVYLSSESPNVLDRLDDQKVYIIGGLVDHNHHKGLCHRLAEEKGVAHAQLPIGQLLHLKSRKVLTINHVFEILLRFTETKDWQKSFLAVLPQRKGISVKEVATECRFSSSEADHACGVGQECETAEPCCRTKQEADSCDSVVNREDTTCGNV